MGDDGAPEVAVPAAATGQAGWRTGPVPWTRPGDAILPGPVPPAPIDPTVSDGDQPAIRTLPPVAGLAVVAGLAATLAAGRVLDGVSGRAWTAAALAVVVVVLQYGTMLGLCIAVCRRWGSGSWRHDVGLQMRRRDVVDGIAGWVAGLGVIGLVSMALRHLGIPTGTNNPLRAGPPPETVTLPQWAAVALAGVIMMAAAPFFEEVLFRGVLQRSLSSRFPLAVAIGVQGLAFGLFHFDARLGTGNAGLLVVLSAVGAVLGVVAHRGGGRLGSSMVAHGLHNSLAFGIGVAALI